MRKSVVLVFLCTLLLAAGAYADYFATKADERNGVLTPGTPDLRAGTDTCAAPTPITMPPDPFVDTGDTCTGTNTVGTLPLACNGNYTAVNGEDLIYTVTVGAGNNVSVTATTTSADYDLSIYLLSTCNDGNSCVTGADNCFAANAAGNPCGAVSDETIPAQAFTPGTYFLYIDSFYAVGGTRNCGDYNLTVSGPLPVELMEFSID